jgi:hypothetical protein
VEIKKKMLVKNYCVTLAKQDPVHLKEECLLMLTFRRLSHKLNPWRTSSPDGGTRVAVGGQWLQQVHEKSS